MSKRWLLLVLYVYLHVSLIVQFRMSSKKSASSSDERIAFSFKHWLIVLVVWCLIYACWRLWFDWKSGGVKFFFEKMSHVVWLSPLVQWCICLLIGNLLCIKFQFVWINLHFIVKIAYFLILCPLWSQDEQSILQTIMRVWIYNFLEMYSLSNYCFIRW